MAIQPYGTDISTLFIPNGLLIPSLAHPGENVNFWCQNPDPNLLNSKKCLGTLYVLSVVERSRDSSEPYMSYRDMSGEEIIGKVRRDFMVETAELIRKHASLVLKDVNNDFVPNPLAGRWALADCLNELSRIIYGTTDIVVDVRSFKTSSRHPRPEESVSGPITGAELHLAGTAYNRRL